MQTVAFIIITFVTKEDEYVTNRHLLDVSFQLSSGKSPRSIPNVSAYISQRRHFCPLKAKATSPAYCVPSDQQPSILEKIRTFFLLLFV